MASPSVKRARGSGKVFTRNVGFQNAKKYWFYLERACLLGIGSASFIAVSWIVVLYMFIFWEGSQSLHNSTWMFGLLTPRNTYCLIWINSKKLRIRYVFCCELLILNSFWMLDARVWWWMSVLEIPNYVLLIKKIQIADFTFERRDAVFVLFRSWSHLWKSYECIDPQTLSHSHIYPTSTNICVDHVDSFFLVSNLVPDINHHISRFGGARVWWMDRHGLSESRKWKI